MSLYGTRDASYNWQEEVAKEMRGWGFRQGRYNPCLYFHEGKRLRTFLHGDGFATVGPKPSTFSGQRALDFVLSSKDDLMDKTLMFDLKLVSFTPSDIRSLCLKSLYDSLGPVKPSSARRLRLSIGS